MVDTGLRRLEPQSWPATVLASRPMSPTSRLNQVRAQRLNKTFVDLAVDQSLRVIVVNEARVALAHPNIGVADLLEGESWKGLRCGIHWL